MSQPNERSRIGHNTNPLVTRTTPWPNYYHTYLFAVMRFNIFFYPILIYNTRCIRPKWGICLSWCVIIHVHEPNDFFEINGPRHDALQEMSNRRSSAKSFHYVFLWGGHASSNRNAFHDNANAIEPTHNTSGSLPSFFRFQCYPGFASPILTCWGRQEGHHVEMMVGGISTLLVVHIHHLVRNGPNETCLFAEAVGLPHNDHFKL